MRSLSHKSLCISFPSITQNYFRRYMFCIFSHSLFISHIFISFSYREYCNHLSQFSNVQCGSTYHKYALNELCLPLKQASHNEIDFNLWSNEWALLVVCVHHAKDFQVRNSLNFSPLHSSPSHYSTLHSTLLTQISHNRMNENEWVHCET